MLNSAEQEFQSSAKKKTTKIPPTNEEVTCFKSLNVVFIMLINVKMPAIVGILTFMSRTNFVLS